MRFLFVSYHRYLRLPLIKICQLPLADLFLVFDYNDIHLKKSNLRNISNHLVYGVSQS